MKNFSLKNKLVKKAIFPLLFLAFLLFLLSLFYNQGRSSDISITDRSQGALAKAEEEEEAGRLICGKEIPVGEAMGKTAGLLNAIITELEAIETNLILQIKVAEEITKLAEQCNVSNCQPVCRKGFYQSVETCLPQTCSGQLCPNAEEIETLSNQIAEYYDKIEASKKRIDELIGPLPLASRAGTIPSLKNFPNLWSGSLATLTNGTEFCSSTPASANPVSLAATFSKEEEEEELPIGTVKEIEEDLYRSRNEFDKCYVPAAELEKVGKLLLNCDTVMSQNLPRETKTEEKGIPVCTSFHNWFCCY